MAVFLAGCANSVTTNPPRSVTEELLLSTAADRALSTVSFIDLKGKKVYLDATYFDSYDPKYVLGSIRDALSQAGALLVDAKAASDIVIEARSGGLSTDASDSLFGVSQTGLPIPLAGVLNVPELAIYKSSRQKSIAKLALLAYSTHSLEHVFSTGPMVGKSYNINYKLLGMIQWTATDIPEKKRKK
jgi:hypothetical protein